MTPVPAPSVPDDTPCLDIRDLGMSFPGVRALDSVSLRIPAGRVHGLLGANGAGKSTLVKILNGIYPHGSYQGEVLLYGQPARFGAPHAALEAGIGYVPQELNVVEQLTVGENIFVGRLPARHGLVHLSGVLRDAQALLDEHAIPLRAKDPIAHLRASERQLVMLARALAVQPKVLILDEPTSSLTAAEAGRLFRVVRRLRDKGVTTILITHRLPEVFDNCDSVSVLRDGRYVAGYQRADFAEDQLVQDMVGRRLDALFPERGTRRPGTEALRVQGLSVAHPHIAHRDVVHDVSFQVAHGEILGIAGLMGAGRTELLSAIYGRTRYRGQLYRDGVPVKLGSPKAAKRAGIALLTEDRAGEGMLFNLDVAANVTLGSLRRLSPAGLLRPGREAATVNDYIGRLSIKTPSRKTLVGKLSGGNQQKVILARVLLADPGVVLLDEPTKGVDIATKQQIYRLIHDLAARGVAVVLVSSELPELIGVCDRFLVLADGRIVDEFGPDEASEERVVTVASAASR